jgi:hypothetical protein
VLELQPQKLLILKALIERQKLKIKSKIIFTKTHPLRIWDKMKEQVNLQNLEKVISQLHKGHTGLEINLF